MADRRLLGIAIRGVALLSLVLACSGCMFTGGGLWLRQVEGEVFDTETREPIAGAEVFVNYQRSAGMVPGHGVWSFDTRWTTSDEAGRFSIPGKFRPYLNEFLFWGNVDSCPHLFVHASGYGNHGMSIRRIGGQRCTARPKSGWRGIEVPLVPATADVAEERDLYFRRRTAVDRACWSLNGEACLRLCEIATETERCRLRNEERVP